MIFTMKGRKIITGIALLMLIVGIGLLAYPHMSQYFFQKQAETAIHTFQNAVAQEQKQDAQNSASEQGSLQELYQKMQAYNEELFITGQAGLVDPFSYEQPSFDLSAFGFAENIVGYIEIPRIDVCLPIYLGASKENMEKGAVHLSQTSLPIGGQNTNCVIAAHRGSLRGFMFRNIHKLAIGDDIFITNFKETLTYRVTQTKIIDPDDIGEVMIQSGEDMVTLSSCHPLGSNHQRYLVYAKRVDS
ncbi:MAG: class C sortase [Clostridiales bacterium]|nr:class C sortase [Clostridiales bacterium]